MANLEEEKIPEYLYVTKIHENKVRGYKFVSASSHGKYLYEDIESGFKECFLHADIFSNTRIQRGYSNSSFKAQKRNECVRKFRSRRRKGVAYERRFKQFNPKNI